MKISAYPLSYTIVAPSGEMYPTQEVVMYTASQERAIQLLGVNPASPSKSVIL
ncbi:MULTISPECIES: hypothetical protein [Bacillus]|uniref:hypothetical protein n=1 Tax=Bacillus TaxID=1386 RepID=UPI001590146D|nr:hypothetical protein [Bacillus cereus]